MLNRKNYTRNGHDWNPMPDMELESLRGVRIFGRGVREKGGSDEPPEPPLVTGLDLEIIKNSLIGNNGGNRCLCKVCAGGAQSNNSVGAQHNCVTRCYCRGLSLRCCNFRLLNQLT